MQYIEILFLAPVILISSLLSHRVNRKIFDLARTLPEEDKVNLYITDPKEFKKAVLLTPLAVILIWSCFNFIGGTGWTWWNSYAQFIIGLITSLVMFISSMSIGSWMNIKNLEEDLSPEKIKQILNAENLNKTIQCFLIVAICTQLVFAFKAPLFYFLGAVFGLITQFWACSRHLKKR